MQLVWTASRKLVRSSQNLSPIDDAQLRVVSKLYFGEERDPLTLLPDETTRAGEGTVLRDLTHTCVEEDGVYAYDAWTYLGDSGAFFRAGTTTVVGEIVLYGFQPRVDTEWGAHFALAYRETKMQRRSPRGGSPRPD